MRDSTMNDLIYRLGCRSYATPAEILTAFAFSLFPIRYKVATLGAVNLAARLRHETFTLN
jgi:hypothetical protein